MILHESVVIVKHVISKSMMLLSVKLTLYLVLNDSSYMTIMYLKWATGYLQTGCLKSHNNI